MPSRTDARLEVDGLIRPDISPSDHDALTHLLSGIRPDQSTHPLHDHPLVLEVFHGESLDHATTGSFSYRGADGCLRLRLSASVPPERGLPELALEWLERLLVWEAGDVAGFLVPAGSHRHDARLLIWDGAGLRRLAGVPDRRHAIQPADHCSPGAFLAAADLPPLGTAREDLEAAARDVALGLVRGRAHPISQARLDGPLLDGQAAVRRWLLAVARHLHGLTTEPPLPAEAA